MDRMIYLAMTGARHVMDQQSVTSNNLANLGTTGFRAQLDSFRAVPVQGPSLPTRAYVVDAETGTDFAQGPLQETGRELDVAVRGRGWIALQAPDGGEVYSRNGNLQLDQGGLLTGQGGMAVLGEGGPITVPADARLAIAPDGSVSAIDARGQATAVGRIKLVNPPQQDVARGEDGLFRLRGGAQAPADGSVLLSSGRLEGSNVNAVEAMVNLVNLSRSFDLQMNLVKNAENNEAKAGQILNLN